MTDCFVPVNCQNLQFRIRTVVGSARHPAPAVPLLDISEKLFPPLCGDDPLVLEPPHWILPLPACACAFEQPMVNY
jgi:hypothetical protein